MNLIATVLLTFAIGFFVKNRMAAYLTYVAIEAFVLPIQTGMLILEWANGDESAFGPFPASNQGQTWSYAVVNLVIFVVGLGLLTLGARIGARRRSGGRRSVDLDPAAV